MTDVMRWTPLALVFLLPVAAQAQEPAPQPVQELFLTDMVYPQEKGEVQLTIGALVDRTRDDRAALVPLSVEYGLTNHWQVEVSWDGYTQFHSSPLSHLRSARLGIGTKYSFMNIAHSPVHAAVGLDVEFPDAGAFEDDSESEVEYEPSLSVAADLTRHVTVFAAGNLSLARSDASALLEGERLDDTGTLGAGVMVALGRVTVAAEYTSRTDNLPWRIDGSPLVTPSLTLHPGGHWELGFGVPIGVHEGSHRPGLAMHVIKEF